MAKLFGFCAALLAFLVAAVAAIPQEHLAPAAHHDNVSRALAARSVENASINYHADKTGVPVARVQARQVHNADYGSDGGPSGNPKPSQASEGSDNSQASETNRPGSDARGGGSSN